MKKLMSTILQKLLSDKSARTSEAAAQVAVSAAAFSPWDDLTERAE